MKNVKTIDEAKTAKDQMCNQILKEIETFESIYGEDSVQLLRIIRWNGSNYAFGKVSRIETEIRLI